MYDAQKNTLDRIPDDEAPKKRAAGVPVFSVGELFVLRGVVFQVRQVERKLLGLEPVRPATRAERKAAIGQVKA